MFCHACGARLVPNGKFCHLCAAPRLSPFEYEIAAVPPAPAVPATQTVESVQSDVPQKKGSHLVPILIMTGLVIVGLILFVMTGGQSGGNTAQSPTETTAPVSETPWFTNEDGTLYFDASLYTGPEELVIPETVDGQAVTCISKDCFAGNEFITTVILPDTLVEIGDGAFANCKLMRGIFIPEGVKRIGAGAFRDCVKLEAVCIPASTDVIGYSAFRGCLKLKYILYSGKYEDWNTLYSSHIANGTQVYCTDGTFLHGVTVP